MKKIMMLASVASVGLLLTASAAFAATSVTAEQQYIESYKGRTDVPVPLVVVSPKVNSSYAGRVVELSFTVEPD
ncbi:MAG TPA: hypothetical protein VKC60_00540, partial [Opitutaceae bacterium]|nr:hypothetical protein [Opitutaceae bacterium]